MGCRIALVTNVNRVDCVILCISCEQSSLKGSVRGPLVDTTLVQMQLPGTLCVPNRVAPSAGSVHSHTCMYCRQLWPSKLQPVLKSLHTASGQLWKIISRRADVHVDRILMGWLQIRNPGKSQRGGTGLAVAAARVVMWAARNMYFSTDICSGTTPLDISLQLVELTN